MMSALTTRKRNFVLIILALTLLLAGSVFGDLVEVLGDASAVGIIDPEPPPTPAPVVCSNYGYDRGSCEKDPSCWWNPTGGVGNGGCENK